MKKFALVTGASSGLGLELSNQLAEKGFNLILVSRTEKTLQKIKADINTRFGVEVVTMPFDLSVPKNAETLFHNIEALGLHVSVLVNNAGVGIYGDFTKTDLQDELNMIQLNITSLVVLTKLFLQKFVSQGEGKILNMASLLSFLPFPYFSVYSATKAFVLAFTETVAAEVEGTGVSVLALCPGPIDTGFNTDTMLNTAAYKTNKPMSAKSVAKIGIKLLEKGHGKAITGFNNWFISNLPRITPDFIMMKIKKGLASQKK